MKMMILTLAVICGTAFAVSADSVSLGRLDTDGETLVFQADGNAIMATPEWIPGSPLPLEPNQALSIIGEQWDPSDRGYELQTIEINRVIYGVIKNRWYYKAVFAEKTSYGYSSNVKAYIVLMDGSLVKGEKQ